MRRHQNEPGAPGAASGHAAVIRLDTVTKAYQGSVTKAYQQGGRPALAEVSITVAAGEVAAIMGPSGSGKSTLLNLIAGLDRPTTGTVTVAGQRIDNLGESALARFRARHIGFIFQFFNLLPTLTAVENVALPLLLGGQSRGKALPPARAVLERIGLAERAEHFPDELSGGEMQRVAIARALVIEPEAVLCDEPTGNLDSQSSEEVLKLLRSLPEPGRRAVVMVTHDAHAAAYGDRIVYIRDGLVDSEEAVLDRSQDASIRM